MLRTFAIVYGIAFLGIGIVGFIPGLTTPHEDPDLVIQAATGRVFGLFPVNVLHNLVHIAFGVWGLAATTVSAARFYARSVAVIYALLMVMGLIPGLNTMFGLVPLYGHDVWLHALLAAIAAYFGFVHSEQPLAAARR
jgi:hypothetical protein